MRTKGARWCSASRTSRTIAAYALSAARRVASQVERLAGVRGAAAHGIAGRARHRQRLARQRRLVDRRRRGGHDAVDRHDLAGANHDDVAGEHGVDGDLLHCPVAAAMRDPRRPLEQPGQLALGAVRGGGLQRVAAAEHQRDHRAGEQLAQGEGTGHRQQRDGVDPHVAGAQRAGDRDRERHEHDPERGRPDSVARARCAGQVRGSAHGDRCRGQQRQQAREALAHRASRPPWRRSPHDRNRLTGRPPAAPRATRPHPRRRRGAAGRGRGTRRGG